MPAVPLYDHPDAVPIGAAPGIVLVRQESPRRTEAHTLLMALAQRCYGGDVHIQHRFGYAPQIFHGSDDNARYSLSISHAGPWVACACWPGHNIGIDLCRVEVLSDAIDVATHYFDSDTYWTLLTAPPDQRAELFAQAWARLEACGKCLGSGLEEWSKHRDRQFSACESMLLAAPPGHICCLARQRPSR